jgi:hypothetical protein
MDRVYLIIICASVVLLVAAFGLGTPKLKPDSSPKEALVQRMLER